MKPFDIKLAKQGKPVCTRDGRKVRIICFDVIGHRQPIIALVTNFDGKEDIETYYLNGRFNDDINGISDYDLIMAPEKKTGWINLISAEDGPHVYCAEIYPTEMEAVVDVMDVEDYIATIQIEWEE